MDLNHAIRIRYDTRVSNLTHKIKTKLLQERNRLHRYDISVTVMIDWKYI